MIVASKRATWIVLVAALFLHILLISYQLNRKTGNAFVRLWVLDALAPVESGIVGTFRVVDHLWSNYVDLLHTRRENEELRSEIARLRTQLSRQHEDTQELERLKSLLAMKSSVAGRTVAAGVVGRDPTQFHQTVTIDKGRIHGVVPDTAVITPVGVVGRVLHAGNFFSIVQLVSDSQSGIGVFVRSTRRQAILKGTGGQELELDYIDDDSDLKEGDLLLTSGMDRIYPKGLSVGVIASVGARQGLFKAARIRPVADLDRLEEVLCLVDRPEAADAQMDRDGSASVTVNGK